MENHDWLLIGPQKLSPTMGSWFYSGAAPFSDNPSHLGAGWLCGGGQSYPHNCKAMKKRWFKQKPYKPAIDLAWGTWPPWTNLCGRVMECTDWLKPGSHATIMEPGSEIVAQNGKELVLSKQMQRQGNGCCMGEEGGKKLSTTIASLIYWWRSWSSEMENSLFKVI